MARANGSTKIRRRPRKKSAEAGGAVVLAGRPPNFTRLRNFFASQTAMATALGVQRDTIRVWERGRATRLRRALVQRVMVMSAVAEQVARYMPTDKSVGDWLLSPQPGLGGESPSALVRRRGVAAYEPILRVARVAEPVSVGDVSDLPTADELRAGVAAELGEEFAERIMELPEAAPEPDEDPDFLSRD
jgi:hypothetical protein